MEKNNTIARIENTLIFNAEYQMTAKEQKVMLYLISNINPKVQTKFESQTVALKNLESVLMNSKKNGSFYQEIKYFASRMVKKGIEFTTEIEIDGEMLPGYINWFQSIVPTKTKGGEVALRFKFSEDLKPFLLELREYAQIDYLEILPLKSGFSIRLFQVFKAYRSRMAAHQKRSKLKYGLEELKSLLGVAGKYADYRNFRLKVLEVISKEVNKQTSIGMKYTSVKEGRSVVGVEFEFWDKATKNKALKSVSSSQGDLLGVQLAAFNFSQIRAFENLVAYGVNDGIAQQIVGKEFGSEIRGFEDWYFEECIKIVELKSTAQIEGAKPGIFVNWFLKLKVFEQGDQFAKIMEILAARKKALEKSNVKAWENRLVARGMTAEEFRKRIKDRKKEFHIL